MIEGSKYKLLEVLHEGTRNVVYRGLREADGERVIVKVARAAPDGLRNVAKLRREHAITQSPDVAAMVGVVRSLDLELSASHAALIFEDFGGTSLRQLAEAAGGPLDAVAALRVGIAVAEILGRLHDKNIIHKDITPGNIIVHPETLETRVTDLAISTVISGERSAFSFGGRARPVRGEPQHEIRSDIGPVEGALAYISPEQTGRMNRAVDYRTDYYSLGVTLYEILTGRLPFDAGDPMELVHCHIAKIPAAPDKVHAAVPEALSAIVMKLLAKTAEDRYQSAYRLKADLERCLDAILRGEVLTDFVPGVNDMPTRLQISQKLYGREEEVAALMAAFDRVSSSGKETASGQCELALVSGYSGVGKSSIVHEVHKPIARQRGYFIAGKFDQLSRTVPYASIIAAFQELVRQLLTESEAELAQWQQAILDAIVPNGQVIVDVIPDVELLIGPQPPIRPLGAAETKNRFNLTFRSFIRVFPSPSRPLVLFLDDLQWADAASLELLSVLVKDSEIKHLLVIGAYRDNEVAPTHPLALMLNDLGPTSRVHRIALRPLRPEHVGELVADTLGTGPERCWLLSSLLVEKTGGNPFFAIQLLTDIYRRGHLYFDEKATKWSWDMAAIEGMGITANVVDLMIERIQTLDEAAQHALRLAAIIGNRFDLATLALLRGEEPRAAADELWGALEAGLVVPLGEDYKMTRFLEGLDAASVVYKFLHDRVQQAAYAVIPPGERRRSHLALGRLLLAATPPEALEEHIFDVVTHLNLAAKLIEDRRERRDAASLNLRAARRARASTAYEPALQFLNAAAAFLPEDAWDHEHDLALAVYSELVDIEYLTINFDRAEAHAAIVTSRAKSVLEKIRVYETRIQSYVSQNKMHEAIAMDMDVLGMLGVSLEREPPAGLAAVALADLPEMTDPEKLAALRILMTAMPAVYIANTSLLPSIAFTMVKLCVEHGSSPLAAYAYSLYGLVRCGFYGEIDEGLRFSELALDVLRRFRANELESKVYALIYIFVYHWKKHVKETLEPLLHGVRIGLETGDIEYAGYNAIHYSTYPFFAGEELSAVDDRMHRYEELSLKLKQEYQLYYIRMWRQLVRSLRELPADRALLAGDTFDERTMLPCLGQNRTSMFSLHMARAMQRFFYEDRRGALESARLALAYEDAVAGFVSVVEHNLYESLALLACLDEMPDGEREEALAKVDKNQERLFTWASHAPMNNRHKHDLVSAERARVVGSPLAAMEYYDRAIEGARRHGYMHEEALAYELAARSYMELGRLEIARHYMTKAHRAYQLWGAAGKARDLAMRHARLVEGSGGTSTTTTLLTTTHEDTTLDLMTAIKASQAMASEIVLGKLLQKLMTIVIENTGAQRGTLLLARDGALYIEAEGATDSADVEVLKRIPVSASDRVPRSIVSYVARTKASVVVNDVIRHPRFSSDAYVQRAKPRSILCSPIVVKGALLGVFYFENNLTTGAFNEGRLELLTLLSSQVAISIENSRLYEALEEHSRTLEQKVKDRTQELARKNEDLAASLRQIHDMQQQIVVQEKLASLGTLTAGIAHEIQNPLNFVKNFAEASLEIASELREELGGGGGGGGSVGGAATSGDATAELLGDLEESVKKIHEHAGRIDSTVRSMLNLSRDAAGKREDASLNDLVAEYLNLAYHGMRATDKSFNVAIEARYDPRVGQVSVVPHDIGRVVLNLCNNAFYAIQERWRVTPDGFPRTLSVVTTDHGGEAEIRIRDNGRGIPAELLGKIWSPFFTTKPTGKGTGLGLSICHEIIVQEHKGTISVASEPGQHTEFTIRLPKRPYDSSSSPTSARARAAAGRA